MNTFVAQPSALRLILAFARRDLRGGLRGFGIFIACIAIGVAAITAVATVSRGLTDSLAREGRTILGADAAFVTLQREATADELAWLSARGLVAPVAYLRAMARAESGDSMLVEGKAVESPYPIHGVLETEPRRPAAELLAERNGVHGAIADPLLLARLNLKVGDSVTLGEKALRAEGGARQRARQARGRRRLRAAADDLGGRPPRLGAAAAGQPRALELPGHPAGRPF